MQPLSTFLYVYFAAVSFVFGCIWGSFFNVCIYRIPARKSIVAPRSHCYTCGTFIRWYDNIPLLSYLLLRGNCRDCGAHFSPRYFGVELLSGLIFLAIYLQFGPVFAVIAHCIFASFLIVGTFTDIDYYIIPDGVTIGGLMFALLAAAALGRDSIVADQYVLTRDMYTSLIADRGRIIAEPSRVVTVVWALASAGFGWLLLAGIGFMGRILFRKEAMGGGDVKLFAFLGAYLGAVNCFWVLFLSAVLGSCIGLSLILTHRFFRKDEYEEIELLPDRAVKSHLGAGEAGIATNPERDTLVVGHTVATPELLASSEPAGAAGRPDGAPGSIQLRIARSTARQLHHFPFGPYIAVAALLVMFFHEEVDRMTRNALFLPQRLTVAEQLLDSGGL
jgi:leader peptidase (prepilin peptidase) / N-methyltransferase